jgi:hypothetical protein
MVTRRRRFFWGFGLFAVILIALAAWIGIRAMLARQHLLNARTEIAQLRSQVSAGNIDGLSVGLAKVESEARAAKDLTSDPIWSGLSHLPLLGLTLSASNHVATSVNELTTRALGPLLDASKHLDPKHLRRSDGTIDLAGLASTEPDLKAAQTALQDVNQKLEQMSVDGVVGPVVDARMQLLGQLHGLTGTIDTAYRASRIAPVMLGADGPRRYLMVFETPAESRGTGGLVGSYAIISIDHGKITREHTGSNTELQDSPTPVVDLGPEFNTRYGSIDAARGWRNANFTPNFPWAAEIWQRLWERQSGEKLDGVISVDPVALGYMLDVTGPITLSDGEVINGQNAAEWSMVTSYAKYGGDSPLRKQLSVELATKTLDQLTSGDGGSTALLKALGRAAGERRLLIWSAHPAEQAIISGTPPAGELPEYSGPFTALVLRNGSGDKLDYYVTRSQDYRVLSCGPQRRLVQVTATLNNTAPRSGLPAYVTNRADGKVVPYGQDRVFANIYSARGSLLEKATLNGKPIKVVAATERGLAVYEADVELPIGAPQTVTLTINEPRSTLPLHYLIQPLVKPLKLSISGHC